MDNPLFVIGIPVCVVIGAIALFLVIRHNARNAPAQTSAAEIAEPEYTPQTFRATVIDQACTVKTVGWKTPRTVKEFMVVFQTEEGQRLEFFVPEEMYDGFEKSQTGTLTLMDGELYGFEPETAEPCI